MAKKKSGRKKSAKTKHSKTVKSRPKSVKPRGTKARATKKPARARSVPRRSAQGKTSEPVYGPSFFVTANGETSPAYELDGTPHPKTVETYRQAKADIREFEEQDGKILYKVKPLLSPVG